MSVSASWLNSGDSDQRRSRQRRVANLSLVPNIDQMRFTSIEAVPMVVPMVVPADYETDRSIATEPRRAIEMALLLTVAIAGHAAVAWWASQPTPPVLLTAPQVPIEVVLTKPPEIPPPAPPKPTPVKKVTAAAPKPSPAPRIERALPPDAILVPAPPQPIPAQTEAVVEQVTEASGDADYLQNPAPKYPGLAQRQGWEGTVWLHVLVKSDGTPAQIDLEKSSGRKTLDDAALAAVKNWRFVPAKRGETAVDGWVSVPLEFKLGN